MPPRLPEVTNDWKSLSSISLGMPLPVSLTLTQSSPPSRETRSLSLPPRWPMASTALRARLWSTRVSFDSSKRAVPRSSSVDHQLDARAVELAAELLLARRRRTSGQVDLAHQDAPLAAGELEHLALHRADEIELLEDEPRVVGALRGVGRVRHELHVPADDGERRVQVVDDAGEEAADGGEPLLALALQARAEEAHRGGRVGGDETEEGAIVL